MSNLKPVIITPKSNIELAEYYKIRFEELRSPWNQPIGSEKDTDDNNCIHRMIKIEDNYIGVARLQYNTNLQAQIRYMAIKKKYQRSGFGKILVLDLENIAKKNGTKEMMLQSRESAIPFYLSLDYKIIKKTHLLFNKIQHFLMRKYL